MMDKSWLFLFLWGKVVIVGNDPKTVGRILKRMCILIERVRLAKTCQKLHGGSGLVSKSLTLPPRADWHIREFKPCQNKRGKI